MKNEALYKKTVDILVQAYFNDTLQHGDCAACAVGNIIAANCNIFYSRDILGHLRWPLAPEWVYVFMTTETGSQRISEMNYNGSAKKQIDSTGYTWQELSKVEHAFETAPKGESEEEYMFNGLMAVIDVLDKIHENNEPKVTTATKQRFLQKH